MPVPNLTEVLSVETVLLSNGTKIADLDAIIFCTGYNPEFSILGDYEAKSSKVYQYSLGNESSSSSAKPLPRIYQNIFSLNYPSSLAYVYGVGFQMAAFHVYDPASMALTQVWKGSAPLPP
ncbi:hypothetical protein BJY04DRAFT_224488 [Aspergillus karnatakaensis]|uniref:uncharacterized protein n=1 Tax=Aspergillus karnatakaensis TaxID=1810916 RepID=UPI003CCE13D0